jgi:hypothetical protein
LYWALAVKKTIDTSQHTKSDKSMLIKDWNENAQKVGGIISGFLHHEIFRQYLKSEVLKTFDGDYDVLLSKVVLDIKNGLPPVSRFTPLNEFFEAWQLAYLEQVAEGYPQMQLSVQTDPEQWTTPSFVPPVVFTPGDYDEASTTTVPVVDVNGNISGYMDALVDPTDPVVIITLNERTYIGPNGEVLLSEGTEAYSGYGIYQPNPLGDSLDPVDPNDPIRWYRQNYKYESIYALNYQDIGRIEGWPAGGPETRIYSYSAENPQGTNYRKEGYYHGQKFAKRKDVKGDNWFVFDTDPINCHLWRWYETGSTFKYAFYEYDDVIVSKEEVDSLASFATQIPQVGSTVSTAIQLVGLFLKKDNNMSEFIGELEISANNNATQFRKGTGGFGWRSKPY